MAGPDPRHEGYLTISRYIFLIGPVVLTLLLAPRTMHPSLVILILLIVLNSQLRRLPLTRPLRLVSLIGEVALVLYVDSLAAGFLVLMLFSTLHDAVVQFWTESNVLAALVGVGLGAVLSGSRPLDWTAVVMLLYMAVFFILQQWRKEGEMRTDVQVLYDRLRRSNYQLEAARTRLLDYSRQVERVAQLEERNWISRELHDSVGHSLTGIRMQVDAAIQLLSVDPDKGMEVLRAAYGNIGDSIETVRRTVRNMRPTAFQTYRTSLQELIDKFGQTTGVHVSFAAEGSAYELYPSIQTVLYRNTQEALTNSVRHGQAKHVQVTLRYGQDEIKLVIIDDGLGAGVIKRGLGISGMEERLELVGGTLKVSGERGFRVEMMIPRRDVVR